MSMTMPRRTVFLSSSRASPSRPSPPLVASLSLHFPSSFTASLPYFHYYSNGGCVVTDSLFHVSSPKTFLPPTRKVTAHAATTTADACAPRSDINA